ncbi:MAG: molybdenum cofactor biosynthesis protein MoaE [Bacteroidota bacterium]
MQIQITDQAIEIARLIQETSSEKAGALSVFLGTVRNHTQNKTVVGLEYEAYEGMALKKMEEIALQASKQWPIESLNITHRVGKLKIGEVAVLIAVATPHRQQSFEACQFLIDTLKEVVPIWKKEIFEDGEVWVAAHP